MEKNLFDDSLMTQMIEEEAWKSLSGSYPWNESQLEQYKDKLDWEEVSGNTAMTWTVSILTKFKGKIHWDRLSSNADSYLLAPAIVEKFVNHWDWKELSENSSLPMETIDAMAEHIDWKALIDRRYNDDAFGSTFLEKYQKYIPASALRDSYLWRAIVEEKEEELKTRLSLG